MTTLVEIARSRQSWSAAKGRQTLGKLQKQRAARREAARRDAARALQRKPLRFTL